MANKHGQWMPPSHGENTGSIPVGSANEKQYPMYKDAMRLSVFWKKSGMRARAIRKTNLPKND